MKEEQGGNAHEFSLVSVSSGNSIPANIEAYTAMSNPLSS